MALMKEKIWNKKNVVLQDEFIYLDNVGKKVLYF